MPHASGLLQSPMVSGCVPNLYQSKTQPTLAYFNPESQRPEHNQTACGFQSPLRT